MAKPIIPVITRNTAVLGQITAQLGEIAELRPYSRLRDFKAAANKATLSMLAMVIVSDLPHSDSSAPDGLATPGVDFVDWLAKREPYLPVLFVAETEHGQARFGKTWLNQPHCEIIAAPKLPALDLKKHVEEQARQSLG